MGKWLKDVREFKHTYLAKELSLSREQQNKFFPIYDQMEDDINKLNQETRAIEREINEAPEESVTDLKYDMAIEALYNLKANEAEIENSYLEQFRNILSKRQIFLLKGAEKKFSLDMMKRHHQIRKKDKDKKNKEQ